MSILSDLTHCILCMYVYVCLTKVSNDLEVVLSGHNLGLRSEVLAANIDGISTACLFYKIIINLV